MKPGKSKDPLAVWEIVILFLWEVIKDGFRSVMATFCKWLTFYSHSSTSIHEIRGHSGSTLEWFPVHEWNFVLGDFVTLHNYLAGKSPGFCVGKYTKEQLPHTRAPNYHVYPGWNSVALPYIVGSTYKFEFSNRPSDRSQIWHACAHRYSHLNRIKQFDPPHPRGV